ncbi:MAG: type VI secretion system baseplate subunit TssK [Methylococcaceae bacterium]|nr:type VI secretion system baseplate subunit TssK [Methylococcaceae bacterium]MCI0734211.1 type VI secretion system baseplate subunit TssK [Methylococcaceae bacterium]
MGEKNRVVWSEGMFLRPQHFQQHDRYVENLVTGRCAGLRLFDWGFNALRLDSALLGMGKIALTECKGIFQDGTPFNLPDDNPLPLPLDIPEGIESGIVYLALPVRRPGSTEVDSNEYPDAMARYHSAEVEVRDNNMGAEGKPVLNIGELKTRLMLEHQERSGHICIGVARIIEARTDKTLVLDTDFIPPNINCLAIPVLAGFIKQLHGLLHTRVEELAGRVSEAGRGGVAEISDFLLLQVVNRHVPLFEHLSALAGYHPESFYRVALQLAGELATFTRADKRPISFPAYKHDDLKHTFAPVMEELRESLSKVLDKTAIPIPLSKPKYGIYAARMPDIHLLESAVFVLAVNANLSPDLLRSQFPAQVKIGPVEKIQQLVRSALPGITVLSLPVAPRQIPYHAGFSYFELSKTGELWAAMKNSGGFAFHIGGEFPGLELEFWAIRSG